MRRRFFLPVACCAALAAALLRSGPDASAQAGGQASTQASTQAGALPEFEVASVRPSSAGEQQHSNVPLDTGNVYSTLSPEDSRSFAGGLLIATRQPLWRLISFAYGLSGTQELALRFNLFSGLPKSGAPTWVTGTFTSGADSFDIEARAAPGTTLAQMRLMMQALLAERFHLLVHHVAADGPVFALELVRAGATGPELRPHPASSPCPPEAGAGDDGLPPACGVIAHVVPSAPSSGASSAPGQHFGGRAVPLSLLATSLPTMTGLAAIPRPVIDRTGLTGPYDFTLSWTMEPAENDEGAAENAASFREALRKELGLRLTPARAPLDLLVIDRVEHPTEN